MPYIHSVTCTFPSHYYHQEELINELKVFWQKKYFNSKRIENFQKNVLVSGRHLALPLAEYRHLDNFEKKNKIWINISLQLVTDAITNLIEQTNLAYHDIQLLVSNSITGIAVPSLEAKLMNRLPFSPQTKRLPIFGLGCLAGVAGINRVADYLIGHPQEAAIFFSVELCSLTLQLEDLSIANIISTGLFGDGCAAVLMVGDEHPLVTQAPLKWLCSRSSFFPDTEEMMGWELIETGLKIILSREVARLTAEKIPLDIPLLLKEKHLTMKDLSFYIAHPGGPKVLRSLEEVLELSPQDFEYSWKCLKDYGNMSSVSVLYVLKEFLLEKQNQNSSRTRAGHYGLMMALGPAFCSEMGLLQCQ